MTYLDWNHPIESLSGTINLQDSAYDIKNSFLQFYSDNNSQALFLKDTTGNWNIFSKEFLKQCKIVIAETKD